jgi:hypothetical protein
MSLGIVFKAPEGVVLGADSRVTLTFQGGIGGHQITIPATYDNATKLLKVENQQYVAAITFGTATIGLTNPRTAHSFLPEFERELTEGPRLSVEEFAKRLSDFFERQWNNANMPTTGIADMRFLVAGYNENEAYGRVYELGIPSMPAPLEQQVNQFGLTWGGQGEITARILNALDDPTINTIQQELQLTPQAMMNLINTIKAQNALRIPYQFLPLQDCVDLVILLIHTTLRLMNFVTDVRGVGGPIDVAMITRTEGVKYVQAKQIHGE